VLSVRPLSSVRAVGASAGVMSSASVRAVGASAGVTFSLSVHWGGWCLSALVEYVFFYPKVWDLCCHTYVRAMLLGLMAQ
jgi:hypothetical protein